mmetsp:Transcript_21062/g.67865  ORF Transcript_21062/g.67865 Transcript_21062/m.67865 type:complete len:277 (-) Transcript_21062:1542-2372(-)
MCLLLGLVLLWALAMADECGDGRYPVSKVDSVLRGLAEKVVPLATGTDLRRCVTLLPAGTGTESLTEGLRRQFNETRRNWAHSHDHRVSTKDPCYVMTLRDPSKRFESGWRHPTRAPTTRRKMQGDDANAFVDRFRRGKSKGGLLRRWYLDNVRYREHRGHGWFRFWTAQTDYLSGLTADQQIAFVCLENFAHDWANLIGNSGENGGEKNGSARAPLVVIPHSHARRASTHDANRSTLSADNAAFVRNCLYPWDTRLHDRICKGGGFRGEETTTTS